MKWSPLKTNALHVFLKQSESHSIPSNTSYDPFQLTSQLPPNPYQDPTPLGSAAFFQGQSGFQQPVSIPRSDHKCSGADTLRSNTTNMLRLALTAMSYFLSNAMFTNCSLPTILVRSFRKDLLRLCRPCLVSPNLIDSTSETDRVADSQLPAHIESYHSLVPLDTNHQKNAATFGGYNSWIYKAQSSQTGNFVALRRLEGQ